ncbi:hypothetical protein DFR24_2098 [Panacagrimonas perspica]|uniref:Uncharacterized protein n=1 Tax=Panacagrimonas perspica TaxID=381431 RepID=A0A4R7PEV4_9GAMM|nr:hypothetical protein DFR24_2098 [Panacagrimonas perspica]
MDAGTKREAGVGQPYARIENQEEKHRWTYPGK